MVYAGRLEYRPTMFFLFYAGRPEYVATMFAHINQTQPYKFFPYFDDIDNLAKISTTCHEYAANQQSPIYLLQKES